MVQENTQVDSAPESISVSPADPLAVLKSFIAERNTNKGKLLLTWLHECAVLLKSIMYMSISLSNCLLFLEAHNLS